MAGAPVLIPSLVTLRSEFNTVFPGRDHASDGWIGDTAHSKTTSDHNPDETGAVPIHDADTVNEVHAVDVDDDLRGPIGVSMETVVQHLLKRCRSGAEKRLRYIIYNRRIWEASNGWRQRDYTGASPHTEHAHFSGSYDSKHEADKSSWHLKELVMATQFSGSTAANDVAQLDASAAKPTTMQTWSSGGGSHSQVGDGVWNTGIPRGPGGASDTNQRDAAWRLIRDILIATQDLTTAVATLQADNALMKSQLDSLTADPASGDSVIVGAVRYANANP